MGNSFSQSGGLFVCLEQGSYRPGETVRGDVCVNVSANSPAYRQLEVLVEGHESSKLQAHRERNPQACSRGEQSFDTSISEFCHERSTFLSVLVPIKVSADKLSKPGQYQFPFAFKLPTYLPPSFKMRQGSAQGEITYHVSATLAKDRSISSWMSMERHTAEFTVSSVPPEEQFMKEVSTSKPVATCSSCFLPCMRWLNRGPVQIRLQVDRDCLEAGQSSRICAIIQVAMYGNMDRQPFQASQVIWSSREGPLHPDRHVYNPETACVSMLRVPANCASTPSVHGQLVRCKYLVQCAVKPASGWCRSEVAVSLPLVVLAPPGSESDWELLAAPADWKPEKLDPQWLCHSCENHEPLGSNTDWELLEVPLEGKPEKLYPQISKTMKSATRGAGCLQAATHSTANMEHVIALPMLGEDCNTALRGVYRLPRTPQPTAPPASQVNPSRSVSSPRYPTYDLREPLLPSPQLI